MFTIFFLYLNDLSLITTAKRMGNHDFHTKMYIVFCDFYSFNEVRRDNNNIM